MGGFEPPRSAPPPGTMIVRNNVRRFKKATKTISDLIPDAGDVQEH